MDAKRIEQLHKTPRQQGIELQERLVATLTCAGHGLKAFKECRLEGRPNKPETHDFNARFKYGKKLLAIEITSLHGAKTNADIFNPTKIPFWQGLTNDLEGRLRGKVLGTFAVSPGEGGFPNIPGTKRSQWLQTAQQSIVVLASGLGLGESKPLGSPPEIANMELEKLGDTGSEVRFPSSPIVLGNVSVLSNEAIEEFCSTTLMEKNNGSLKKAKQNRKTTILAVVLERPVSLEELHKRLRSMWLNREIPNIDHMYLVSPQGSNKMVPLLAMVF